MFKRFVGGQRQTGRFAPFVAISVFVMLVMSLAGMVGAAHANTGRVAADPSLGTVGGWVGINSTATGTPISRGGITISFYAKNSSGTWVEQASTSTNSGGNYSTQLAPGSYKVYYHYDQDPAVKSSWYNGAVTGGFVTEGAANIEGATVLNVLAGQSILRVSTGLVDAKLLPQPGTVGGWVGINSTATGTPISRGGITISFYAQNSAGTWVEKSSASTNTGGNYSAQLAPGSYKVYYHYDKDSAVKSSWYDGPVTGGFVDEGAPNIESATVLNVVSEQSILRVSAGLVDSNLVPKGVVSGKVTMPAGVDATKYSAHLRPEAEDAVTPGPKATLAADGSYRVANVPAGDYRMVFSGPNGTVFYGSAPYDYEAANIVRVAAGQSVTANFTMPNTVSLTVAPDAVDWASTDSYQAQLWRLDENDNFVTKDATKLIGSGASSVRWSGLLPGDYKLTLTANGVTYWYAGDGNGWDYSVDLAMPLTVRADTTVALQNPRTSAPND